jgi:GNAT superfamily N-acetyltransferase
VPATIRPCLENDRAAILEIINDAAQVYRGVIPADRWHEPYMPSEDLDREIAAGVRFFALEEEGRVLGVMGIQDVGDVTLIRHAYVRTSDQGRGAGGRLLGHLRTLTDRPVLMGTWADAGWAIAFYRKHGFELVTPEAKDRLLRTYWSIPERQVETSVVLADAAWRAAERRARPR